jgi:hypothetical protein
MSGGASAWLTRLLALGHAAGALGLVAAGVYTYRLHCESFACFALGLMWMVWAAAQALTLGLGLWARARTQAGSLWRRLALAALGVQALSVAAALVAWVRH